MCLCKSVPVCVCVPVSVRVAACVSLVPRVRGQSGLGDGRPDSAVDGPASPSEVGPPERRCRRRGGCRRRRGVREPWDWREGGGEGVKPVNRKTMSLFVASLISHKLLYVSS